MKAFERRFSATIAGAGVKKLKFAFVLAMFAMAIAVSYAKEGADQYAYGAENWFTGALPPAGWYYINYFGYYTGELRNGTIERVLGMSDAELGLQSLLRSRPTPKP